MLINFKTENYNSVKDEACLTMEAYTRDRKRNEQLIENRGKHVLPVACMIGANASGKTNIIQSLRFLRAQVVHSMEYGSDDTVSDHAFRFDAGSRDRPTSVSVRFSNENEYLYSASFLKGLVEEESLYIVRGKTEELMFERRKDSLKVGKGMEMLSTVYGFTPPNTLLLSKSSQFNVTGLRDAYEWFSRKLRFYRWSGYVPVERLRGFLRTDKERLIRFYRESDYGICDLMIDETSRADETDRRNQKAITALHTIPGHGIVPLPMTDESNGTIQMTNLAMSIMEALDSGGVLFVDELSNSLHPLQSDYLVEIFMRRESNPLGAQIVFSTHDAGMIDRNGFRRDQVWLTSRDPSVGATELYSLLDYDIRNDLRFSANYLAGRFGAIPYLVRESR